MSDTITVTIAPEPEQVRLLARCGTRDILRAVLGPVRATHPRAAATMLEGLALWHQRPLCVVLCADTSDDSSALTLYDALGAGQQALHYAVGVACADRLPRRRRPGAGLGDFGDLRRLGVVEVPR